MSDFSDRPFVAGSLIGLRAFSVDGLGRLTGPAFKSVFKPGENEATCGGGTFQGQMQADIQRAFSRAVTSSYAYRSMWSTMTTTVETPLSVTGKAEVPATPQPPKHVVGGVGCGCGYYAYFNGENTYGEAGRVSAIIEGYGVCTVGDKGFRASKARLVALVIPETPKTHPVWFDGWADGKHIISRLVGAATLLAASITLDALTRDSWWAAAIIIALVACIGVIGFVSVCASFHKISREYPSVNDLSRCHDHSKVVRFDAVRQNYPDVPVYRSVKAALANHPLTPPEPDPIPSPTDDEFWTMDVPR